MWFTTPPSPSKQEENSICNMHVAEEDGHAAFRYQCCRRDEDGEIVCKDMKRTGWIKVLLALILVTKIMVVLYSPMFLPESLYRLKYKACEYVHHIRGEPISLKVLVTQNPFLYGPDQEKKVVRLSRLPNMEYFKTMVSSNVCSLDRVYEVDVEDIRLSVKPRRLLERWKVPVRVVSMIYNNLFRCKIRHMEAVRGCCESSVLGRFSPIGVKMMQWGKCMQLFAGAFLLLLVAVPWIVRLTVYNLKEYDMMQERRASAERVGLSLGFSGSLLLYLNPVHGLFVGIYAILIIDSLIYGVLSRRVKEKLNFVLRQCLRDMRERPRVAVFSWFVKLTILPFSVFGILGFVIFPLYLPLLLLVTLPIAAFYLVPSLNLSLRLVIHMFIFIFPRRMTIYLRRRFKNSFATFKGKCHIHDVIANESFVQRNEYTSEGVVLQLVSILICLLSFWSVTLLFMEITSFFVEVAVYTFMGLVVNAGVTLQYCTVIFLLCLYAKNTFTRAQKVYKDYHQCIHDELLSMKKEAINEIAKQEASQQQNMAFRVTGDMTSVTQRLTRPVLKIKRKIPYWSTSGMLVFLNHRDTAHTPEKFFHKTIDLDYFGCPGKIYVNMLRALWNFVKILIFLIFVFVIVMAFGDAYHVSSTNQLLATVVGGVIPFFLQNFFKSDSNDSGFDTSSIQFTTEFHTVINQFEQAWPIYDIIPTRFQEQGRPLQDGHDNNKPASSKMNTVNTNTQSKELKTDSEPAENNHNDDNSNSESSLGNNNPDSVNNTPTLKRGIRDFSPEPLLSLISIPSRSEQGDLFYKDDDLEVDIIVDVSTTKMRRLNLLQKQDGLKSGSVSMLNWPAGTNERSGEGNNTYMKYNLIEETV